MNVIEIYKKLHGFLDSISDKRRYYIFENLRRRQAKRFQKLTSVQIRAINALFDRYHKVKPYSHSFYTNVSGVFSPDYIPDSLWYAYIEPFYNPRTLAKCMDDKTLYDRLLHSDGEIVHPKNIGCKINGFWLDSEFRHITEKDLIIEAENHPVVFLKEATDSAGGHGVVRFFMPDDKERLLEALAEMNRNAVLQVGINQHPVMQALNPSSVNTIRVLSHLTSDGRVIIRSTVVRIGQAGSFVDNASSGGFTVGVNPDGSLKNVGYDVTGKKYYTSTNGLMLDTFNIPNYGHLSECIERFAWQLPMFRLLSWDIAIDAEGRFILIEVNMHSGQLDFHQMNNGPVFGQDTENVLKEVFLR